jgi:glycosyltransferase involved in cell wall biosynthesis
VSVTAGPLHLLVLNEFFHPDVCASAAVLSDHLPRLKRLRPDWRITVLTGNRAWDRPDVTWPARESWNDIDIVRVPRPAVGRGLVKRGLGFLGFHRSTLRIGATLDRPDVIMSSTAPPLGGRLGDRLARVYRCAHIYRVLDLYPDCATTLGVIKPGGLIDRIWRRADTTIMRRADAVVAISQGIADRIIYDRRIDPAKVHAIHDGFDIDRVRYIPPERNAFRRECGLADKFVIQYAGNMGLSHPFDTILAAAEQILPDERFVFQFIGAGPGRKTIHTARARLRDRLGDALADRFQLLDYQPAERLPEVLSTADVALISQAPGMSEFSLPYKFYGIIAAARPAIFIGPAASEIVRICNESPCGMHIEQGDAAGLTATLRTLATDAALRAQMSTTARALFESRFTSDKSIHRWSTLIASHRLP